jgi:hypothetical protein
MNLININMNEEELSRLIEKYYSGESTEEEENKLKEYFKRSDIPEGYEAEKIIFRFYNDSADYIEPSVNFEEKIISGIDVLEKEKGSQNFKRYLLPSLSAAAGLLLLAGSYFFFMHKSEPGDTFKDPKIAYNETIKILRDVSIKLNRGSQVLEPVGKINEMTIKSLKTINKSTRYVKQNIKNLELIEKALDNDENPGNR